MTSAAVRSFLPSQNVVAAFVGFASTFAMVLRGITAADVSPAEAASGLGFGSISGVFWGLLTGGALLLAIRLRARLDH